MAKLCIRCEDVLKVQKMVQTSVTMPRLVVLGLCPPTGGEKFHDNLTTDNVFAWDYRCSFRFDLYNIICV